MDIPPWMSTFSKWKMKNCHNKSYLDKSYRRYKSQRLYSFVQTRKVIPLPLPLAGMKILHQKMVKKISHPQKQRLIHPVQLQFQNLNFDPGGGDLPPHSRACQETASFMLTRSKDTSPPWQPSTMKDTYSRNISGNISLRRNIYPYECMKNWPRCQTSL